MAKKTLPKLEWRDDAIADMLEILLSMDSLDAAQALKDEIESKAAKLPAHPRLYKESLRIEGQREMVVRSNYIVFYRESADLVEIVNVVHH